MKLGYNSDHLDDQPTFEYAVVIPLPEHLNEIIDPVRRRFDPDHHVIGAHVTVVFPFRSRRPVDEVALVVRKVTESIPAIAVSLSSIGDFYPIFPLIYWGVNRDNTLDELYKNLYASLDLALPHKLFIPHVTVAREISAHRVVWVKEQIVPYLPDESFMATSVDLIAPVAGQKWVAVQNFPLRSPLT
ncbi:MAG TPA: 2'-5' RNA ligase family protein [Candidatus Acidoferrum sp.]|nr:2'-5' RNA ligase family protein [Candidatus Acidoferrum sp.]